MRSTLRGLTALPLVATALLSCDSPMGPKPDPFILTLGHTTEGTVTGTDSLTYRLHVKTGELFVVFVDALDSGIVATILDPAGGNAAESSHSGPRPAGAVSYWSVAMATAEGDYTVRVRATGPSHHGGGFELRPEAVNSAPESTRVLIHPNDTISTEALERPGDVDDFAFDGQAGEEVNLFLQSLAPPVVALDIMRMVADIRAPRCLARAAMQHPVGGLDASISRSTVDPADFVRFAESVGAASVRGLP